MQAILQVAFSGVLGAFIGYLVASSREDKRLLSSLRNMIDTIERLTSEKDELKARMSAELNSILSERDDLKRQLADAYNGFSHDYKALETQNNQLKESIVEYEALEMDWQGRNARLQERITELEEENTNLANEVNEVKMKYVEMANQANGEIGRLNQLLTQHQAALADTLSRNESLMKIAEGLKTS